MSQLMSAGDFRSMTEVSISIRHLSATSDTMAQPGRIYRPQRRSRPCPFTFPSSSPSIAQIIMPPTVSSYSEMQSPGHLMHHHSYELVQHMPHSEPQPNSTAENHSYLPSQYDYSAPYAPDGMDVFSHGSWTEGTLFRDTPYFMSH